MVRIVRLAAGNIRLHEKRDGDVHLHKKEVGRGLALGTDLKARLGKDDYVFMRMTISWPRLLLADMSVDPKTDPGI